MRHSILSEVAALPVISSKAIDFLRSPQLEQFLQESLTVERDEPMQTPQEEDTRNEPTSLTYYQAQKLISLCGWELRRLPYLVDTKDQLNQSSKDVNLSDKSILSGKSQTITVYSSCTDKTSESKPDDDSQASEEAIINPNSVVLDCRLCVVGLVLVYGSFPWFLSLWNFYERPANLSLTIAGGPPPATHNYRAKVSLPIIGRNLRAWFIAESELKDDLVTKSSSGVCKNPEFLAGENTEEGTSWSMSEVITEAQMENSQAEAQVSGKELQILSLDKALEFDPFRPHRYFFPWIASNGGSPSGWEQTLSALARHEESSSPLSSYAPSSSIKVDDPLASVQKLFTSPLAKRRNLVRPS
ncbi:hypothetical protein K7X08_024084 [Anisodus acutangulus]|uniref:Uncharacterized protein n=1 Tax=Anisodus acutangulus TaxID=402998 RepID=A0A9Q1MAF8_9SOLA|nr:hypothetical protein K7X08_024084 [Anisodus acutangulus]